MSFEKSFKKSTKVWVKKKDHLSMLTLRIQKLCIVGAFKCGEVLFKHSNVTNWERETHLTSAMTRRTITQTPKESLHL